VAKTVDLSLVSGKDAVRVRRRSRLSRDLIFQYQGQEFEGVIDLYWNAATDGEAFIIYSSLATTSSRCNDSRDALRYAFRDSS